MTVWFGVGLIVYVHLAILLVGFVCTVDTRRLRIRVKELEAKPMEAAGSVSHAVNSDASQSNQPVSTPHAGAPHNPTPDPSATRSQVRALAAQGLSENEIARQTGTPRAEVDFLLKLRRLQQHKAKSATS